MKIKLNKKDAEKMSVFMQNQNYDDYLIIKKIFFFHNDKSNSKDGLNHLMIEKFKKLNQSGLVSKFVCCYPKQTGLESDKMFIESDGEISGSFKYFKNNRYYLILQ